MNNSLIAPRGFLRAAMALAVIVGCIADHPDEQLLPHRAALTLDQASVLGFETLGKWSFISGGTVVGLNAAHTQGVRSLEVAAQNYVTLTSVPLSSLGAIGPLVTLDVMLPSQQANPYWYGAIQMYATAPSLGIYNSYLGQVELTGLPLSKWQAISFQAPADVVSKLSGTYSDLTLSIAINVPYNQTGTYLLDNLRFSSDITPTLLGIATNSAGVLKAVFTYQTSSTADIYIPYGPSNGLSTPAGFIAVPPEMPPQTFVSRQHPPFAATLSGTQLTWKVGNKSATATTSAARQKIGHTSRGGLHDDA